MSNYDELTLFLSRADRLVTVFDIERALADWDKTPRPEMEAQIKQILDDMDNLGVARTLVRQLDTVKKMLLDEFGSALESELKKRVGASTLTDGWALHRAGKESWSKQWAGQRLMPRSELNLWEIPSLHIFIQQAYSKIYCGICRTYVKKEHPDWEIKVLKELETKLRNRGYHTHQWWLGYERLYYLDEDKFFLKASGNMEKLVGEIADIFMKLFEEYKDQLEVTNRALEKLVT